MVPALCLPKGPKPLSCLGFRVYLEGHGDFVSRLITDISGVVIWLMGVINLLTKSP